MPGLAVIVTKMPEDEALKQLNRMVRSMCHESFYVSGVWADPTLGVYVGWVARKGSFSERMPLVNETGDVTLIFSGEDYPESDIIQTLRRAGHAVPAEGPSYLVHLYEEDPKFPAGLNGIFQGIVVDRSRQTATLFNDRYGMQRFYWHESSTGFFFAAEAKAILTVCPETRDLNPVALGEVISCGCAMENRSLFVGTSLLPAGSSWVFCDGTLASRGTYFSPYEWEEQQQIDSEPYYRELRSAVTTSLSRYLSGTGPVAVALTGGLDTRVIMAWAKAPPDALPCFTYGGSLRDSQDVSIGRQVAELCRQPHQVISVDTEFLSRFPYYAERTAFLADGCASVANSPDLFLSEMAREVAPLKVVGTWGSELLRRAITFKPSNPEPGLFQDEMITYVNQARETYTKILEEHPVTFAAFRQTPWAQYGVEALEQTQLGICAPFLSNEFVRTVYRAPSKAGADVRGRLILEGDPRLAAVPSDRGVHPSGNIGLGQLAGRLFQEFTFKAEYLCDMGMPKRMARVDDILSPLRLCRLFLGRHKFLHFRTWYRSALSDYVKQILLDPQTLSRPHFERGAVYATVLSHTCGTRNHTNTIHLLLTLELLQRHIAAFR